MYEVETLNYLVTELKTVEGVSAVIKGNPSWGRPTLTPPAVAIEIGAVAPAVAGNRIGNIRQEQQWNVFLFGQNEPDKVRMVGAFKDWIRNGVHFALEGGQRIAIKLVSGEPHRPLTDAQSEQYGYVFVIESV